MLLHTHTFSIIFTITTVLLLVLSMRASKQVKSAGDFAVANRDLSYFGVSWAIIGTLVGGASTIGTVEMAYKWGFAGWYFTLGSGIACFILAIALSRTLRDAEVTTVSEFLGRSFGSRFQFFTSLFTALGMFVHIVAQFLAAIAILVSVFACSVSTALVITIVALLLMVVSGGMVGASWIGQAKFVFLCLIMGLCAIISVVKSGGASAFFASQAADYQSVSFFSYGIKKGGIEILSVIIGVLSTQTYLQAIFSARDVKHAYRGAMLSAVLIPPIGVLGIIIGLYLRAHFPGLTSSAQALPFFIKQIFPEYIASVFMAGLFFVVLGTGSGLALGVTTNLSVDFLEKLAWIQKLGSKLLRLRVLGVLVLVGAAGIVLNGLDTTILAWSYLSMGLRGSSILPGLLIIMFLPGRKFHWFLAFLLGMMPVIYVASVLVTRK